MYCNQEKDMVYKPYLLCAIAVKKKLVQNCDNDISATSVRISLLCPVSELCSFVLGKTLLLPSVMCSCTQARADSVTVRSSVVGRPS